MLDDGDGWKTGVGTHRFGRGDCPAAPRRIVLVDKPVYSGETYKDVTTRARDSRSGHEIRYIDPAIYAESVNNEEYRNAAEICGSTGEQEGNNNRSVIDANPCNFDRSTVYDLPLAEKHTTDERSTERPVNAGHGTYRCYSSTDTPESLTARSTTSSRTTAARAERRCRIVNVSANDGRDESKGDKYVRNNRQVVRISISSPSVGSGAGESQVSNGPDLRRIAHSEWVRRKQEAAQRKKEEEDRAARKRQEEEEKLTREKEERARLEKENFLKWIERKRQQELHRKAMLENELELQRRLKEIEDKAAVVKALNLRQWICRKEEEQKARDKEQEMKQKKINEERERRLQESSKAYEKWKENSKNKPKPATQGLLPHQKAKPAYVNPIPWQPIVEGHSDEEQENIFKDKKRNTNQLKINGRKPIAAHH